MKHQDGNDIVITGMSAIIPEGPISRMIGAKQFALEDSPVARRLKRCCPQSALIAVETGERAMKISGVSPDDDDLSWGFYTSQNGYQHPDFSDFVPALSGVEISNMKDILPQLWKSRKLNPFLLIHGLSNNLLGVLSLHWKLRADCSAFIRDETGVAAALQEAIFSLDNHICDIVLVVNAGTNSDWVTQVFSTKSKILPVNPGGFTAGACALVLEHRNHAEKRGANVLAQMTLLPSRYQRNGYAFDWLRDASCPGKIDIFVHELNYDQNNAYPCKKKLEKKLQPRIKLDLAAEQTHKGCAGLAFNILVAAHLISEQKKSDNRKRTQHCLVINSGLGGHTSAALLEG